MENSAHCDFVKLRNMLVRTHMQDLKDVTRETHYENYRAQCIQSMTRMVVKERNRKYDHTEARCVSSTLSPFYCFVLLSPVHSNESKMTKIKLI